MTTDFSWLSRTALLVGEEGIRRLAQAHVMIVGLGGVGSFAAEFIARGGVGRLTIIDGDTVDPTNRNRQLVALATNHGQPKAQIMSERLRAINPEIELNVVQDFIRPEKVLEQFGHQPDYLVDAIDSMSPKLHFMQLAYERKLPLVSSMGAGGKVDPTQVQVTDISKTYNCPFSQYVRKTLKKQGIYRGIRVVFSPEENDKNSLVYTDGSNFKKSAYGTMPYMPAVFGAATASVVIRALTGK
jgi:tRNA A37 threonylcarbamoyladenosine dehydratase